MDDEIRPYNRIPLSNREALLLLELIMQDLRMNWGPPKRFVKRRKEMAMLLAKDLCFFACVGRLYMFERNDDGRWLRAPADHGGYEDLDKIHLFPRNEEDRYSYLDRSLKFRIYAQTYLTPGLMTTHFYDY